MGPLLSKRGLGFKSPVTRIILFLRRSRETCRRRWRQLREELNETKRDLARKERECQRKDAEIAALKRENELLRIKEETARKEARPRLPEDPSVGVHGYGAWMVSLAVNLARDVGFRGAERAINTFFAWLGIEEDVPKYSTIQCWMQRTGVALLKASVEKADDWVWIVDHSNQIGPEKALVILGIRASKLPPPGTPLKHEDVRLLLVKPGTGWTTEKMTEIYEELAERCGYPRAILSDGARELQNSVEPLKNVRCDVISLRDFKHKAANLLKAALEKDERFSEFLQNLARIRSRILQTELAFLLPPSPKQKARYMNLGNILKWTELALWLLDHPDSIAAWVTPERLAEKLGGLRQFAADLAGWREYQHIVDAGVKLIGGHGLFQGAAEMLRTAMEPQATYESSKRLSQELIEFVADSERHLQPGERLPMSTEIIESCFGLYKQLERQHSKGGFTGLLAAFGALLGEITPETVRRAFKQVSTKDAKQWVRDNLGETLVSKRQTVLRDFRHAQIATLLAATG